MKRKMLMVVNPVAGKGKIGEELMEILQLFCEKGWLPTVLTTSAEDGQMSRLRKVAGQYDLVVCAGGGDPQVRLRLVEAVSALTGLGSDRISICEGNP